MTFELLVHFNAWVDRVLIEVGSTPVVAYSGLETATSLVKNYLQHGQHATLMKATRGVGVGFVDGNIDLVYLQGHA